MEEYFKSIIASTELYPVDNDFITSYVLIPKKTSMKKIIDSCKLIENKDYIIQDDNLYKLSVLGLKLVLIFIKSKDIRTFFEIEKEVITTELQIANTNQEVLLDNIIISNYQETALSSNQNVLLSSNQNVLLSSNQEVLLSSNQEVLLDSIICNNQNILELVNTLSDKVDVINNTIKSMNEIIISSEKSIQAITTNMSKKQNFMITL
jgi:hypothetical protein